MDISHFFIWPIWCCSERKLFHQMTLTLIGAGVLKLNCSGKPPASSPDDIFSGNLDVWYFGKVALPPPLREKVGHFCPKAISPYTLEKDIGLTNSLATLGLLQCISGMSAHIHERVTPPCTLHARVSCIMELVHGINFVSFGAARAQDDVHVTQFWKTIYTTMLDLVFYGV